MIPLNSTPSLHQRARVGQRILGLIWVLLLSFTLIGCDDGGGGGGTDGGTGGGSTGNAPAVPDLPASQLGSASFAATGEAEIVIKGVTITGVADSLIPVPSTIAIIGDVDVAEVPADASVINATNSAEITARNDGDMVENEAILLRGALHVGSGDEQGRDDAAVIVRADFGMLGELASDIAYVVHFDINWSYFLRAATSGNSSSEAVANLRVEISGDGGEPAVPINFRPSVSNAGEDSASATESVTVSLPPSAYRQLSIFLTLSGQTVVAQ